MTRLASIRVALPGFGLQGFALIVLGTALLSSMHALVRGVSHEVHPFEIAFFRNLFGLIIFIPWLARRGLGALRTGRIGLHAMRGVCNAGSMMCWFTALSLIPLAQASALSLLTPLVVAFGASAFLGERVGLGRWLAAVAGIVGTLVIVRPGFETVGPGVALVLASSVLASGSKLFAKELSANDSAATIVAYVSIFMSAITLVPALFVWRWPDAASLIRLVAIGVLGTTAHVCIVRSYRWLDVSFVEPFMFLRLPWAAVIGFVAFAEVPSLATWTGGLIIGAAIVLLAWHEHGRRARARPVPIVSRAGRIWRHVASQGMGRALRHRQFRTYVLGNFASAIGYWVQRIGVGWLTWKLTASGSWLGIMGASEALPIFFLVPIAGAVADRVDRLRLFRWLQIANGVQTVALTLLVVTGRVTIGWMVALVALGGICQALAMPLRLTMGPNLVPHEDIAPAIGLNSILFQLSVFVGPALAGIIIDQFGIDWAFIVNSLSYVVFVGCLYAVREVREERGTGRGGLFADAWDGIVQAARDKSIGPLLLLVIAFAMFTRPYLDMMPGIADAVYHRGAHGLATLVSAAGAGGLIGGLLIAQYARIEGMTRIVLAAVVALSVSLFAFAMTPWYGFGLACVVVISGCLTVCSTGSQMLIQTAVQGAMRGRIMSLYGLTWRGAPAVGALVIGAASSVFGLQVPLAAGAVLCFVAWLAIQPRRHVVREGLEGAARREMARGAE